MSTSTNPTRYAESAPQCFRRDVDAVHEALRPFVVAEPWPHPAGDTPAELMSTYRRLMNFGYANGWLR